MDPPSSPVSCTARETIVLSTVSRSSVELTACPTSPNAWSSPTDRVSCVGTTDLQRSRRDRVEHRLRVRLRLADHAEDFARRRLLLEGLLGLVEQANVLNRDHGLVGEGLEQGNLPLGKAFNRGAAET